MTREQTTTQEVAGQVRQAALERADSVRENTQSAKQRTVEQVRKLSGTVRKIGEHMRIEDQQYIADKAGRAGERLESVANYLNSADVSTILRDTGTWARGNPAAFFGSAFVLGIAAGRFLKTANPGAMTTSSPRGRDGADR
jgi:hypothetical protein